MNITVNNLNINYEMSGSGRDILMLHGWGSSLEPFRFIFKNIPEGYRVTSFDFPGFGKSDELKRPWTVSDYCDFTLDFINALKLDNPILICHSFGGRVAIKLCGEKRLFPEKIIFIDAAGIKHPKTVRQKIRQLSYKTAKKFLSVPLWKKPCEPLLEKARSHFGSEDYNNATPIMRQTLVNCVNEDLTDYLDGITASSLLIYGENDTATPVSDAKIMETKIADSGLCIIKNAGHFSFIDSPYEVNAIIHSFLEAK
ncbi:MAG: alpha/beta fold hydrolase [Acutalibacteraceae bacterium]